MNDRQYLYCLVLKPFPTPQGQEYAALGALVNDDEPLSSPPGSTEMELKVKQVCSTCKIYHRVRTSEQTGCKITKFRLFITVCSFRLFACLRKFCNAETFWGPPGIKIYLFLNKFISFELIFSAHTTAGKLRMHNDIWRHQEDIPWAHAGCVWKRKRRCHFANRSMEETGQSISSHNLKVIWVC